ncbi:MAG: hypothetical protein AAGG75_28740 [Bacteroidota bacterium]
MTRKPKITSLDDDSGAFLGGQRKMILNSSETARVLNYVIPGQNFETFFEKMAALGAAASQEAKAALAKEHGIQFLL